MSSTTTEYKMDVGGTGQDGPRIFIRKDAEGNAVEVEMTDEQYMAHRVPPKGVYRLRITGFQVPFEQPNPFVGQTNQFGKVDERATLKKTKIDLTVVKGDGSHGAELLGWCPWPNRLTDKNFLGRLFLAATGADANAGTRDVTEMIGAEDVYAAVDPSGSKDEAGRSKYAVVNWESVVTWTPEVAGNPEDADLWG